ncbi:MAG: hypothetical protein KDI75_10020 [Xanthomonadales bacterium]|nr:hypothetical protein [Xanthomonadales bacterium]
MSPSYYGTSCELVECCSDVFTAWPTGGEQSMCIAGCEFTPDGGDLECGSVGGEPWCIYTGDLTPTGDVCGEPSEYEPIDDPDPNDEWRCDPSTGVCLDENDNPHHCTFDGGGSPVNCVPFTDSDGDGVQDPDDPDPEDPDYSDDEDTDGDGIPDQRDPYPNDATNGTQDSPEADGPVDPDADNVASGGGTCGAPPSCSGDGIGCAILWQTWRRGCDTKELLGQLTQVGELGDDDTEGVTVSEQLDLLEQLDTITAPGGGACPQPPTFNAFGQTYELPFTDVLCPLFAVLAPLIVFGAYLAAARIVLE